MWFYTRVDSLLNYPSLRLNHQVASSLPILITVWITLQEKEKITCHWYMKINVSLFGSSALYLSWYESNLFVCKASYLLPIWCPLHYEATHSMSVEASDFPESVSSNILTPLDPLNTLFDIPIWFSGLYMSKCLLDLCFIVCDHHQKMRF